MDANRPAKAEVDAIMAQVIQQRNDVRRLQEEVERLMMLIEELHSQNVELEPAND